MTAICVGDTFSCFEDLETTIERYQKEHFVQFYRRDSRTIESSIRRATNKKYNADIKYTHVTYSCINGGKKFTSSSKGKRPHQHTFRMDCPAEIKIGVTDDGQSLVVKKVSEDHNHRLSEVTFKHLPQQRRLQEEDKNEVKVMLGLKANKKLLQNHMAKKSGNIVILKDLHNLSSSSSSKESNVTEIQKAIDKLNEKPGSVVEIMVTNSDVVDGIFFQDKEMRRIYDCFPEMVFVDATYKLNDLRMPIYLFVVEDGNGETEIVSVWMVAKEDEASIGSMAEIFKKHNPNWIKTTTIMADKDFIERDVLKQKFPDAQVLICLFHVLKTFRREITVDKLGVTTAERNLVLEIIQKMVYAKNEDEYSVLHSELAETNLKSVTEYFDTNWHPIKEEWVECFKSNNVTFQNRTNNRIECINQKLKAVITKHSCLHQFFVQFLEVVDSLRTERDHRAAMLVQKIPVNPYKSGTPEYKYMELLTPYALQFVVKQLGFVSKVKIVSQADDYFLVNCSEGIVKVTATKCTCSFHKSMQLPCRHIFAVRSRLSLDLFSPELCGNRWSLAYYCSSHRVLVTGGDSSINTDAEALTIFQNPPSTQKVFSQHEKYRKAYHVTQKLASLASEAPMREFEEQLATLEKLLALWQDGSQAVVVEASEFTDEAVIVASDLQPDIAATISVGDLQPDITATISTTDTTNDDHTIQHSEDTVTESDATTMEDMHTDDYTTAGTADAVTTTAKLDGHVLQCNFVSNSISTLSDVSRLKLPPKMKRKGRPKGSELTTIGLPKKKGRSDGKPVAFIKKHPKEKERVMLEWFVSPEDADEAITSGNLLEEECVETRPEKVPNCCIDENVNLHHVKKYFTGDAWLIIRQILETKRQSCEWSCKVCDKDLEETASIACDCCLEWYHLSCVNLRNAPKRKEWICRLCYSVEY